MPTALSPATIALVKATVPALEAHGLAITRRMYQRLFVNESIRDLFNQSHHGETGSQPRALADAVLAYARHIDRLEVLGGAVERIAQKHVALNILPEHYPFVAEALLGAIQDVLGEAATDEICAAWGEAYWFLAELLIGREATLYRERASSPGGWAGWRDFVIERVVDESDVIRSFVLVPADGKPVLPHRPGQYLGLSLTIPGQPPLKRNYSISSAPDTRAYRITVKREARPGVMPGIVSNWLHDLAKPGTLVQAAAPAGEFFADPAAASPIVLVSGGVGLTPMVSMLDAIAHSAPNRPVWFVHGAMNGRAHAMRAHVAELARRMPGLHTHIVYTRPDADDRAGRDYDAAGLIEPAWLAANTPLDEADYFVCGPKPFLALIIGGLLAHGVPQARVHYEFFGPADTLATPAAAAA
ncbi:NO-inducible flavohemoprotein [Chitinasiproducens palmae]|uniref:nitric oxide dioxygenase n=1 Tax=Chitinasiproducens palmae TaxID=1770053 RepID=A0A1H2PMY9_9BURK|nr:NO-inducible flavohemoprotein [Chitinasiproducens palmae]SDV47985.1 nitric oxide dioxygenase [Chitinasiproducens palmae]